MEFLEMFESEPAKWNTKMNTNNFFFTMRGDSYKSTLVFNIC